MELIKERVRYNNKKVIRTNTYSHSLGHLVMLFTEACNDFPDLKVGDVEVIHYAGQRYKGTYGIEFFHPDESKNDAYDLIENVEFKL